MLFLGSSSIYSSHINHSGQDSITKFFFRASIFRSGLEACLNKNSNINPVSTKCRLQTGYKMQTRYKMQTENLYCFSVWTWQHVILQLTERHAIAFPRSSFTIICTNVEYPLPVSWSFHIILSLHLVFSLCARVSWCDGSVCHSSIQFSLKIKNWKLMSIFDFRYF